MSFSETEFWRGLLSFLPALRNREPLYWRVGPWGDMPSVVSRQTARDLRDCLNASGLLLDDFNWQAWQEEALAYLDYRLRLQTTDLPTLRKLLTTHLHADQQTNGHFDALLENGFLRDVVERVAVLLPPTP